MPDVGTYENVNGDGLSFRECSCCLQGNLNRHGILCLFESCLVGWGDAQSEADNIRLLWSVENGVPNVDVNSDSNMEKDKESEGNSRKLRRLSVRSSRSS